MKDMRRRHHSPAVVLVAALTVSLPASGGELYRWTDAEGRVHFSDRAPASEVPAEVERLPTPRFADPGIPPGHFSVTEQWERLQAERLVRQREQWARNREARELTLREREVAAAERAAEQFSEPSTVSGAVWVAPRRPWHRHRPGHRPGRPVPYSGLWKPDHPAYRPPPPTRPHPRPTPRGGGMRIGG
jgi:hypothetical protein